jgi:hypothetical protein
LENHTTQVSLEELVNTLRLAICLGVVGCAQLQFNVQ